MSWIRALGLGRRTHQQRSLEGATPLTSQALAALLGGLPSVTGRSIGPGEALHISAFFAGVRLLAQSVATLPLEVRQQVDAGSVPARDHPLWEPLHLLPNPEMTSAELRATLQAHLVLWGNAYVSIVRDAGGRVRELWPLRPDRTIKFRLGAQLYYLVDVARPGGRGVESRVLLAEEVWHLRGLSIDGWSGVSPVTLGREPLGVAQAAEEFGGRFFGNDSRPGGILRTDRTLSPEAIRRLKAGWESAHQGLSAAHRVAVLEEGVSWQAIGLEPEKAQFLQTRRFQVEEIARLLGVPLHMIGDLSHATYSNIEHQAIEFVTHSLRPWLVIWEQSIARDLLTPTERAAGYYVKFREQALLRGDQASRYAAYAIGRQWGWLSADDIRQLEDLNALPDGQGRHYLSPLNMTTATQADQVVPSATAGSGGGG